MKPLLAIRVFASAAALSLLAAGAPLRLHPDNPRYFLFRGKPAVLIASGEHYGAVINRDFNYAVYLDELQRNHLNLTRTWSGPYREAIGNFSIANNTLAPAAGSFLPPWPRGDVPGAADGGNKFDLTRWNPEYFARLKDFVAAAGRRGIVVELNLFCPYYDGSMWKISPLNGRNNVNGLGNVPRMQVLTLMHPQLLAAEDRMVRKIVTELRQFDNLYYEICNEPYFGGVAPEWQRHVAALIRDTERGLGARRLISQNIANGSVKVENPNPLVSIFNFHYSRPPDSVALNEELDRVIGNNETGFDGNDDATYRIQGWNFLMAGGALFNNLDYSFTVGHERGDFQYPPKTPGGGSAALRRQLGALHDFFDGMDFVRMNPAPQVVRGGVPPGASVRVLAELDKVFALYIEHSFVGKAPRPRLLVDSSPHRAELVVELPLGNYDAEWIDPASGKWMARERFQFIGGERTLASPPYPADIALRIRALPAE